MKSFISSVWTLTGVAFVTVALSACGGGGGGGPAPQAPAPVVYNGVASIATITPGNASKLTSNIIGGGDAADSIGGVLAGVAVEPGNATQDDLDQADGVTDLALRLNRSFRDAVMRARKSSSAQSFSSSVIALDDFQPCDGGNGSIRIFGTLNDNGTGSVTVTYNFCLIDGVTLNGPATMQVSAFDLALIIPTDFTVSFVRLTLRGPGLSNDAGGSIRSQTNIGLNTDTLTVNVVFLDNITGETGKAENLVIVNATTSPTSFTESITGRVFDQVHGYVDITTSIPFIFITLMQLYPDSGQILLTGEGNRSVRVTALSATLVMLALDLDGNGVPENTVTLKWTELTGPVGGDLGDDDVDGMHNSWETTNGLFPNIDDAAGDKDGDGASNLTEYLAGTDPNDDTSTPPAVDLSLTVNGSPDPVILGSNLTYAITISNPGSLQAIDVVVADTLPAGVNFVSATPGQGSCTGTSSVSCSLGTLNAFGSVTITIVAIPTAEGVVNNTASVTSGSFETNTADNSATSTTTVGVSVAGIQAQIDAAVDGDTVLIAPGIYFGGLNFNGKNITLRSSSGPATTIIHGNQGTAVRMGPGGAINGFTITGSSASFGAGIEVYGQGSLISANVFDGNVQSSGGFGAAIGGNSSSPTIEGNVFRDNSCDNQHLSGVVAFVNSSSPLITNNIFENNPCRAVNLTLPIGNSPQIINNTFVGNHTGIRVSTQVPQTTQIHRNNIIFQNGIGLEIANGNSDADNPVWENNLVFGNTTDYVGTANQSGIRGNISADPMFMNGASGDYHLQPGSLAIDAGSAVGAPGLDFDGTLRPLDGDGDANAVVDIGAYEAP
jgi:uncharacterized repeat protein (TIGR01451 family)